jgi:transposase
MRFVGLDVHKRVVQACILDESGTTLDMLRFELSAETLTQFARRTLGPDCAVALEATTNTWAVVDLLEPHCARVVVSNPMRTKAIATAKIKTDKVDATVLAQLLRVEYLPPVWQPDPGTRAERSLASRRSALTRQSIHLKNRLHSVLHQRLIQPPRDLFGKAGRAWLAALDLPPLARGEIDTLLRLLDALVIEQRDLRAEIDRRAYASDEIKLLMTLPGIDVTIAHALVAAIGPIDRFESPERLAAYFGLVPSVRQSAEHAYHGRITKQGNTNVRWLLVQAAQIAGRHPGPLGLQFARLARRKSRNVAIIAIARKLAVLTWHLLTSGQPYRYALPDVVATKLQRLRVSQTGRRKTGPGISQTRPATYGTGLRSRARPSLDATLVREGLPATTSAPIGESKVIEALGLGDFAASVQQSVRVPRKSQTLKRHVGAELSEMPKLTET